MYMYMYIYIYIYSPVEPGGLGGLQPLQIFAKVDPPPIENYSEKKKIGKKYKLGQIPRKLLVALLLSTSCSA